MCAFCKGLFTGFFTFPPFLPFIDSPKWHSNRRWLELLRMLSDATGQITKNTQQLLRAELDALSNNIARQFAVGNDFGVEGLNVNKMPPLDVFNLKLQKIVEERIKMLGADGIENAALYLDRKAREGDDMLFNRRCYGHQQPRRAMATDRTERKRRRSNERDKKSDGRNSLQNHKRLLARAKAAMTNLLAKEMPDTELEEHFKEISRHFGVSSDFGVNQTDLNNLTAKELFKKKILAIIEAKISKRDAAFIDHSATFLLNMAKKGDDLRHHRLQSTRGGASTSGN